MPGHPADVADRIAAAVGRALPSPRAASAVAGELTVLYYALLSWRARPHVPAGTAAFSYHRRSGFAALLAALLGAALVETIAMHFLLRVWSPRAAWTLTALSIAAAVWILGALRSVLLRPILLDDHTLHVRSGAQWELALPRAAIASSEFGRPKAPSRRSPGYLQSPAIGQPNVLLTLREPLVARGPYGTTRRVARVGLALDDPRAFERALGAP